LGLRFNDLTFINTLPTSVCHLFTRFVRSCSPAQRNRIKHVTIVDSWQFIDPSVRSVLKSECGSYGVNDSCRMMPAANVSVRIPWIYARTYRDSREIVCAMIALHKARYKLPAMPVRSFGRNEDYYCTVARSLYQDDVRRPMTKNLSFKCDLESDRELAKAHITMLYEGQDLERVLQMFEHVHEEGF
jgi:hypothetical protein